MINVLKKILARLFSNRMDHSNPARRPAFSKTKQSESNHFSLLLEETKSKLRTQPPKSVEKWLIAELSPESRAGKPTRFEAAKAKAKKGEKGPIRPLRKPRDQESRDLLRDCFVCIKQKYLTQGDERDGLRMLRLASSYAQISTAECKWALQTASRLKLTSGYWLGVAAHRFARGDKEELCLEIIRNAAENGNELSQLLLENQA